MINKENLKKALEEMNAYKKRKNKYNFYDYDNILKNYNFDIFFSIGTRSTGKTTATQRDIVLTEFLKGNEFVKLCRYKDDLKPIYQSGWWTEYVLNILHKHDIDIQYRGGTYYINEREKYLTDNILNQKEFIKESQILGRVIPLMAQQSYKSINYENTSTIIFDEFAKLNDYSYDFSEKDNFKSLLSTIVRLRENVKVYFIGNVLTPYNPYFSMFKIDAMKLKAGKTYTFIDNSNYENPCIVGLEFGESVTKKIDDVPRILRMIDNEQVLGMKEYELPTQVIDSNDWILTLLNNSNFNEFYDVRYKLITSIDDSRTLKKLNGKWKFEKIEYYVVYDLVNPICYLIRCEDDKKNYGLYLTEKFDVPTYKFADYDIRNDLPVFNKENFKNRDIVYGDIELYKILRNKGVKL